MQLQTYCEVHSISPQSRLNTRSTKLMLYIVYTFISQITVHLVTNNLLILSSLDLLRRVYRMS